MKKKLRLISLSMLVAAVIFVLCALSAPNLGQTIYIGTFTFGAEQWRFCYKAHVLIMITVFVASFLVKEKR